MKAMELNIITISIPDYHYIENVIALQLGENRSFNDSKVMFIRECMYVKMALKKAKTLSCT